MGGLTVACVYRPGNGFSEDYVYRLKDSVTKYSWMHDRFVCLTNQKLDRVECIPFKQNWIGWWSKLELFRPGLFSGRVAYFDLDTMIVGDISDLISDPSDFIAIKNWKYESGYMGSGVMGWNADLDFSRIYQEFSPRLAFEYEQSMERWGDQAWIQERLPVPYATYDERYPGRIVSYKGVVRKLGYVPRETSVVAFHGRPRPASINWTLPARA